MWVEMIGVCATDGPVDTEEMMGDMQVSRRVRRVKVMVVDDDDIELHGAGWRSSSSPSVVTAVFRHRRPASGSAGTAASDVGLFWSRHIWTAAVGRLRIR